MALGSQKQPVNRRAVRVEIVKPISHSWSEAGDVLHDLRSVTHRLYTAAVLAAIEADRASKQAYRSGNKEVELVHPRTAAYRAVEEELFEIREWAAKEATKAAKAKKSQPKLERLSGLNVPGGTKGSVGSAAFVSVQKWLKEGKKGRVPTGKHGEPIPVRATESDLRCEGRGVVLKVKLVGGRSKPFEFAVKAGKGSHWARVRQLAEGKEGVKLGEVKFTYSKQKKKWFALLTYIEPQPEPPKLSPKNVLVLHRGQNNLLVAMGSNGGWKIVAKGNKLRAFKRRAKKRREEIQGLTRAERGTGAHGHGRNRRYELPNHISKTGANHVHTLCQQIGARTFELAKSWGCGRVFIEDYGGIEPDEDRGKRMYLERFPNYELKQAVMWSLKKGGMGLEEYEAAYISQKCPACSTVDPKSLNRRTQVFRCRVCRFERPVDFVSCLHALRRANGDAGVWEGRLEAAAKLALKARKDADEDE